MKIYETIQKAEEETITKLPGIYYFRNKINNKYYIGQAINIRKRFLSHILQIKKENNKYPIYRAILKYGINNFEYAIIGVFRTWESQNILKKKLDFLEKKYIKEYNSYGTTGYNQTLGGDGGVLGYKMTEEQKKHIAENSRKIANDGRNNIYIYDLIDKKEYLFSSFQTAADYFNIERTALHAAFRRNGTCHKRYVAKRKKEELYEFIDNYKITNHFTQKYSLEEYISLKEKYSNLSVIELAKTLNVCKKTIYNYEHMLDNPTFVQKEIIQYKIVDLLNHTEKIVNAKEGSIIFNITEGQFRKNVKYCIDHNSVYKKQYKLIRLN